MPSQRAPALRRYRALSCKIRCLRERLVPVPQQFPLREATVYKASQQSHQLSSDNGIESGLAQGGNNERLGGTRQPVHKNEPRPTPGLP
jgi:hypothetical protein